MGLKKQCLFVIVYFVASISWAENHYLLKPWENNMFHRLGITHVVDLPTIHEAYRYAMEDSLYASDPEKYQPELERLHNAWEFIRRDFKREKFEKAERDRALTNGLTDIFEALHDEMWENNHEIKVGRAFRRSKSQQGRLEALSRLWLQRDSLTVDQITFLKHVEYFDDDARVRQRAAQIRLIPPIGYQGLVFAWLRKELRGNWMKRAVWKGSLNFIVDSERPETLKSLLANFRVFVGRQKNLNPLPGYHPYSEEMFQRALYEFSTIENLPEGELARDIILGMKDFPHLGIRRADSLSDQEKILGQWAHKQEHLSRYEIQELRQYAELRDGDGQHPLSKLALETADRAERKKAKAIEAVLRAFSAPRCQAYFR